MHMALHKHINIHTGIYCYDHPSNLMCDGWVGGVVGVKMMTVILFVERVFVPFGSKRSMDQSCR
jgi:hypothetical protein